jgi:threonylcarbamoyladenosine tRNA methylthiotransferase MtaB
MSGLDVITLGCRLNTYESEVIRREAKAAGLDALAGGAVIINTCAVTGEAERQARQAIRKARRDNPAARIIVTGCAAQTDPAMFAAMDEVDQVIGNREKMEATSFQLSPEKVRVADIMAMRDTVPHPQSLQEKWEPVFRPQTLEPKVSGFADHARAFVEVQNGCDHRCTFCIIPFGRGNSRSVPAGAIIDRIKALVDEGYREVVQMIERVLTHVPALPRLRLSSLDSVEIDDRLFALITQEPRLMPHLHLSLQSGDDIILKRMKRRHSRADAVRVVERILERRPDISIGADIIAGFPTETDAMFANSLALIADCQIVHGHIFPYSPRVGTPAARMPQVGGAAIKQRAAQLRAACATRREAWLVALIGSVQSVLVEGSGMMGHAENFAPVRLARKQKRGEIVTTTIVGVENGALIAQEAA